MTDTEHAAEHTAARLRELADELQEHLRRERSPDRQAYAQLTADGERHPWTLDAQRTWEAGGGVWRDHHRAVSYHARAYDLELEGELARAHEYWREALRCWARVVADDGFWALMREQLAGATRADRTKESDGAKGTDRAKGTDGTDGAKGTDGDLVDAVRARLPRDLLEPNLTRALELRASRPDRARAHMTAVRESGLRAEAVAEVRREFARQVTVEAMRDAQAGRYDVGVDALEDCLAVDPTNPRLVEALLYVVRQAVTAVSATRGWPALLDFMNRIDRLVEPYAKETRLDPRSGAEPEVVREFARFEFFRGVLQRAMMMDAQDVPSVAVRHAEAAADHLERALAHDPDLTDDGHFLDARALLTHHLIYAAYFRQITHRSDSEVRAYLGPALRALGTRPAPREGQPELAPQVIARLSLPRGEELRQGLEVVSHLLDHPDTPPQKRAGLTDARSLLALRERSLLRP